MRFSTVLLAAVLVSTAFACGDDGRRGGPRDGSASDSSATTDSTTRPRDGAVLDTGGGGGGGDCADAARWVYLVDSDRTLMRFQPDDLSITPIGVLNCPGGSTPFSMSVDRDARAWVLHQDRRIYYVSTTDASCAPSDFAPNQSGIELFGMGFVADADMSDEETLFVAGGSELSIASGNATLSSIDDASLVLSTIGGLPGWPELTGTGSGELWGFFPDTSPPSVRRIDKADGNTLQTFPLAELGGGISPSAWAFAFWGGRFYVFYQDLLDPSTNVWRVDPDGTVTQALSNIGYRIVGAGVSTCAPVELI